MKYIISLLFFFTLFSFSQEKKYYNYSDEKLDINSNYLRESIKVNLHLPETFKCSSNTTTYPIIVIFDSQQEQTYPHIINSIDMLTSESQVPESIIIGIPFHKNNRYYLTSNGLKTNDTLMGIDRTRFFLFKELMPMLNERFKGNNYLTIIGHSRTAFLVNYFMTKETEKINNVIAASGFYDNKPLAIEGFKDFFKNNTIKKPLKYYFSAGTSIEEKEYYNQSLEIASFFQNKNISKNLDWQFIETSNANHMTNFWMSTPNILANCFSDYNKILNHWIESKIKDKSLKEPIKEYKNDLILVSNSLGFNVNPSITQLFSIASGYANNGDYKTAIKFIQFGMLYYPKYKDLQETLKYYKTQSLGNISE